MREKKRRGRSGWSCERKRERQKKEKMKRKKMNKRKK